MTGSPRVCVVVLNYGSVGDTLDCLTSVLKSTYPDFVVEVLDNGSRRDEATTVRAAVKDPRVRIDRSEVNLGFAGGVNSVIRRTDSEYVVLLNNDTVVEPEWLEHLVAAADADPTIAAVQAKIRSMSSPVHFEYAGAAGGLIDSLGMPYCRGRVVFDSEEDRGQYDDPADLFWGSGACLLLRRDALATVGLLAEDFFFYHEETDLCWRLHNHGWRIVLAPGAVVYHKGSGSSRPQMRRKIFYVHRNALTMLARNCTLRRLVWLLPVRAVLEMAAMLFYVLTRRPSLAISVIAADLRFLASLPRVLRQRRGLGGDPRIGQRAMSPASVLWEYFVRRRRTYAEILGRRRSTGVPPLGRESFLRDRLDGETTTRS